MLPQKTYAKHDEEKRLVQIVCHNPRGIPGIFFFIHIHEKDRKRQENEDQMNTEANLRASEDFISSKFHSTPVNLYLNT